MELRIGYLPIIRALCSIYISIKVTISEPVESSGLPALFVDRMADVSFVHNE